MIRCGFNLISILQPVELHFFSERPLQSGEWPFGPDEG